ncbi:unnamed protein product [Amoebophrya sp. A25]|nr:unnamed protein product [Amoebophrya sp. A25]|eukprot:GSA25T00027080001.1
MVQAGVRRRGPRAAKPSSKRQEAESQLAKNEQIPESAAASSAQEQEADESAAVPEEDEKKVLYKGSRTALRVYRGAQRHCPRLLGAFLTMQRYATKKRRTARKMVEKAREATKKKAGEIVQWTRKCKKPLTSWLALFVQLASMVVVFGSFHTLVNAEFETEVVPATPVSDGLLKDAQILEEKEFSLVSLAVSAMLLGSFAFMMAMFYLVNHPDEDMKRYSWQVISATVSIFIAVLTFQGLDNTLVNSLIAEDKKGGAAHVVLDFAQQFAWFWILQFALGKSTGALNSNEDEPSDLEEIWITEEEKEDIELLVMFWGTLIAHINGFAAINSFSDVQQLHFFSQSSWHSLLAVPLAFFVVVGMFQLLDTYRERLALMDGHKDDREYMWDAEAEECENDVAGLCLSFLTAQSATYFVVGYIPSAEGEITDYAALTSTQYVELAVWCVAFMACSAAVTRLTSILQPEEETLEERLLGVLNNWSCMSSSDGARSL